MSLIFRMFGGIGIMVGAGYLLDRVLGTSPWFIIAGTVCGVVAAFIDIYFVGKKRSS